MDTTIHSAVTRCAGAWIWWKWKVFWIRNNPFSSSFIARLQKEIEKVASNAGRFLSQYVAILIPPYSTSGRGVRSAEHQEEVKNQIGWADFEFSLANPGDMMMMRNNLQWLVCCCVLVHISHWFPMAGSDVVSHWKVEKNLWNFGLLQFSWKVFLQQ